MTKKELLKGAAKVIISCGTNCIVNNAVAFTTPMYGVGVFKKFCIGVAAFTLSSMTSEKASEYADEKIDQTLDQFKKMMDEDEKREVANGVA